MPRHGDDIPELFRSHFTVDYGAPFQRHLNRLEVEIGREDYRHLKQVELLDASPSADDFAAMEEITGRLLKTTQNNYNRDLLRRLAIRVYLDPPRYDVYYRLPGHAVRFRAAWRQQVLRRFFGALPVEATAWNVCDRRLAGFESRYVPDLAGGVVLLRRTGARDGTLPLLTATHGPYDPHTFDVLLFLLRCGLGEAAMLNLGFSGREPLTDENLEKLKAWGIPLNPSSVDVIYPYVDAAGHPHCYKLEEGFGHYVGLLDGAPPELVLDIHGCVGTRPDDTCLVVGMGGLPPYPDIAAVGRLETGADGLRLHPAPLLALGLTLLRRLSTGIALQFCTGPNCCYHFALAGDVLRGRQVDPRTEVQSLLAGEPRFHLPAEQVRWLPGAGGNALQRLAAGRLRPGALCLHVEIPTTVRRRLALQLREMELGDSLDASAL